MIYVSSSMLLLLLLLLLVHVVVDFYFQTDAMVSDKSGSNGLCKAITSNLIHAAIHGFLSLLVCFLFIFLFFSCVDVNRVLLLIYSFLIIFSTHFTIDIIKSLVFKSLGGFYSFVAFIIDQLIHILMMVFCVYLLYYKYSSYVFSFDFEFMIFFGSLVVFVLSVLFLLRPSSIIVSMFLNSSGVDDGSSFVRITKSQASNQLYKIFNSELENVNSLGYQNASTEYLAKANAFVLSISNNSSDVDISSVSKVNNAGRIIGYIERLIVFLFLILGSVTAVVAILAMKTALRFSDLKDDNDSGKAEYIMIGSFLSLLITALVSLLARLCLSQLGVDVKGFS